MLGVGIIYLFDTYNPDRVYDFCSNIRRGRRFLCEEFSVMSLFSSVTHSPRSSARLQTLESR